MSPIEQLRQALSALPGAEQSPSRFVAIAMQRGWLKAVNSLTCTATNCSISGCLVQFTGEDVAHVAELAREAWAAARESRQ